MTMPAKWGPRGGAIRKPTDTKQTSGRIINPPRALVIGGRGDSTLIDTEKNVKGNTKVDAKGPVSDRGRGSKR